MTLLALSGMLVGAVLGIRFQVLVLLPPIVIGIVGLAAVAILHGNTIWTTSLSVIVWAATLQVGYLLGLFTRFVLAVSRLPRRASDRAALEPISS